MTTTAAHSSGATVTWTDAPDGSAGHVAGELVVQIRRLGAGGFSAGWRNGMTWDVSDQVERVQRQTSRHFPSVLTAKQAVERALTGAVAFRALAVRNPFREKAMRQHFDAAVHAFNTRHPNLFHKDGSRNMGNGMAGSFWRGFDGIQIGAGFIDRASRQTLAYAYWKAGQLVRAARTKASADSV